MRDEDLYAQILGINLTFATGECFADFVRFRSRKSLTCKGDDREFRSGTDLGPCKVRGRG